MRSIRFVLGLFGVGLLVGVGIWWWGKSDLDDMLVMSEKKTGVYVKEDERVKMKW